jgi:hypothetical protein
MAVKWPVLPVTMGRPCWSATAPNHHVGESDRSSPALEIGVDPPSRRGSDGLEWQHLVRRNQRSELHDPVLPPESVKAVDDLHHRERRDGEASLGCEVLGRSRLDHRVLLLDDLGEDVRVEEDPSHQSAAFGWLHALP